MRTIKTYSKRAPFYNAFIRTLEFLLVSLDSSTKIAEVFTWCNGGSEIRKRHRPRHRIQSSQRCGRLQGSRRRRDKSSVCTSCSPRSSLPRECCSAKAQNHWRPEKRRLALLHFARHES